MDCLGTLGHDLYNKLCFSVYEAGNGHGIGLNGPKMSMCGVYEIVEMNGLSCVEIIG